MDVRCHGRCSKSNRIGWPPPSRPKPGATPRSTACAIARVQDAIDTLLFVGLAAVCLLALSASLPVALGRQPLVRLPFYPRENRASATGSTLIYAGLLLSQLSIWLNAGWLVSDILTGAGLLLMVVGLAVTMRGNGRPSRPPPLA